jgi:hypothetical protein
MRPPFTLETFARFVAMEMTDNVGEARKLALAAATGMVLKEAKRVIGTYDYNWPQLAPATQEDRAHKGYPANEPLLRDGTLRASIGATITKPGEEARGGLGRLE